MVLGLNSLIELTMDACRWLSTFFFVFLLVFHTFSLPKNMSVHWFFSFTNPKWVLWLILFLFNLYFFSRNFIRFYSPAPFFPNELCLWLISTARLCTRFHGQPGCAVASEWIDHMSSCRLSSEIWICVKWTTFWEFTNPFIFHVICVYNERLWCNVAPHSMEHSMCAHKTLKLHRFGKHIEQILFFWFFFTLSIKFYGLDACSIHR